MTGKLAELVVGIRQLDDHSLAQFVLDAGRGPSRVRLLEDRVRVGQRLAEVLVQTERGVDGRAGGRSGNGFAKVADGVRNPSSVATKGVDWLNPGC